MRVKKTTANGTTLYAWDNDRIFAEYDQNGNPIQETVYFGSTPVALLKDGQTYRIFADQIDTPRVLTDSSNTVLWAWDSKPFGESVPNEDVDQDGTKLSYNLRFPGQYYDAETGKHYNFNRDYDPVTGRYIQSDPIGLDGGMNGYGYVGVSPLGLSDPTGLLFIRNTPIRSCNGSRPSKFRISTFELSFYAHSAFSGSHLWLTDGDFNNLLSGACLPSYSGLVSVLLDDGSWGYKRLISTYEDWRYDYAIGNAWVYYGMDAKNIIGFLDYVNFDRATHRDSSAEKATSIGRTLVNYGILHNFLIWNGVNDDPIFWPDDYPYGW